MHTSNFAVLGSARLRPLATCLALAFSTSGIASQQASDSFPVSAFSVTAKSQGGAPRTLAWRSFGSTIASFANAFPANPASTLTVKNCSDHDPDSLRDVIASASDGSTIEFDMNAMACSTITLTTGQIEIPFDNLAIVGPGADQLTVDGGYASGYYNRIFHHGGQGALSISYLTLTDAKYASNANQAVGGCVYSHGSVQLVGATVAGCGAIGNGVAAYGGGIYATGVTLFGSTVSDNVVLSDVTGAGGGVVANALGFKAKYSTVSDNSVRSFALVPVGSGGGIFANALDATIRNSTISGNKAGFGGGLRASNDLLMVDSTVSSNYAAGWYGGLSVDGHADIRNSTIAFNQQANINVTKPAGILASSMQANSSIFAHNTQSDGNMVVKLDVGSGDGVIAGALNIILATEATTTPPPDTSTGCPRLAPLLDNGGLTHTHAILPGSAAMNAGNNVESLDTDQRGNGFARVVGLDPDVGAYEWSQGSGDVINSGGFETCD